MQVLEGVPKAHFQNPRLSESFFADDSDVEKLK